MSTRSTSSSIDTTRPRRLTWRYQSSAASTVSETRGSRRRYSRRARASSMLTSTRPSCHRYQVATVCGAPSRLSVAITAGLGCSRNSSSSAGSGSLGIPLLVVCTRGYGRELVVEVGEHLHPGLRHEEQVLHAGRFAAARRARLDRHHVRCDEPRGAGPPEAGLLVDLQPPAVAERDVEPVVERLAGRLGRRTSTKVRSSRLVLRMRLRCSDGTAGARPG